MAKLGIATCGMADQDGDEEGAALTQTHILSVETPVWEHEEQRRSAPSTYGQVREQRRRSHRRRFLSTEEE